MPKHDKSYVANADEAPYHPHPAWRPANPPLNEVEIIKAAMADLDTLFTCWMRSGDPDMDVRMLNPDAPPLKISHFHVVHQPGVWASDLNGVGQFADPISVIEFLADVPRHVAALYLRGRLEAAASYRRPPPQPPMPV